MNSNESNRGVAVSAGLPAGAGVGAEPLLRIRDLAVTFDTPEGLVRAVNGVNLSIYPGQTLAVVGESGCGKSVSALSTLQLVPTPPGKYESGSIEFDGRNLLGQGEREMRKVRGNQIAMIFQEPMTSLNPVYTIGDQITEAVRLHQKVDRARAIDIAESALVDVGIADARSRLKEYPHQMSGGMRQRVMIAMALACNPRLLLADEPTTALDVTIQAQILELLRRLQRERGMAIMLITHDLGVVAENADVVAVMYAGRVVEYAAVDEIFANPQHPYTQGLFASIPKLGEDVHRLTTIPGQVPNPAHLPSGCPFHTRCHTTRELAAETDENQTVEVPVEEEDATVKRRVMAPCVDRDPALLETAAGHWVACRFADRYNYGQQTKPDVWYRREDAAAGVKAGAGEPDTV